MSDHVEGVGAAELLTRVRETLGRPIHRRLLNRWLDALVQSGRINRKGSGRLTRYFPGVVGDASGATSAADDGSQPRLTAAGEKLRGELRDERGTRPAMPYRDHVIRDYVPGQTAHLSPQLRSRLHLIGRTRDAGSPPGTFARRNIDRLLLDLTCGSVALQIEAPSYSRLEVQQLLAGGAIDAARPAVETQLILNHQRAIELLTDAEAPLGLDVASLCNLHAALSENLVADPSDEGRLRTRGALLTGTTLVPIDDAKALAEMFDRLLERVCAIPDPFEQSIFLLLQIPYLYPFVALNDPVARLAANIPLLRANLCPLTFAEVPYDLYTDGVQVYLEYQKSTLLRDVFAWAYARSCERFGAGLVQEVEPDAIRLRYRGELQAVLRAVVLEGGAVDEGWLARWGELHGVAADDRGAFVVRARELLAGLHEGSVARYGISRAEFDRWQQGRGRNAHG